MIEVLLFLVVIVLVSLNYSLDAIVQELRKIRDRLPPPPNEKKS